MIPINAYKCSHCRKKVLESHSGMWKHESKCFYNPKTKSCITCDHLTNEWIINGKVTTEREKDILDFKVDGTYHEEYDLDPESDGAEYYVLNDEFQYLYDGELKYYCTALNEIIKLTNDCDFHETKTK